MDDTFNTFFIHRYNRCTKIINADSEDPKYIINVKQFAKFVVDLSDQVAPTDIEEGMRVGWGPATTSLSLNFFTRLKPRLAAIEKKI